MWLRLDGGGDFLLSYSSCRSCLRRFAPFGDSRSVVSSSSLLSETSSDEDAASDLSDEVCLFCFAVVPRPIAMLKLL